MAPALALLLAACGAKAPPPSTNDATAEHDTSADLAEITEFNARYLKAINDEDIATLSSLTTDDHMMIVAGREPTHGKEANDAANGRVFEQFEIDETWTPLETVIDRNLAFQRGTWTVAAKPRAGGPANNSTGKFVRIYQRQEDGSWRMTRDVLLTDPPE